MDFSPAVQSNREAMSDEFVSSIQCNLSEQFSNMRDSVCNENMPIFARVRPMLPPEIEKGYKECIAAIDEVTVRALVPASSSKYKSSRQSQEVMEDFTFNGAFGPECGQFVFFNETMLKTMLNFIEGSNSLVFSYGITGSGKTYTLQGNDENPGIIPLSLRLYFATMENQILKDILVKPHQCSGITALTESEKQKERTIKRGMLSSSGREASKTMGHTKSFAMSLCDYFSDNYEKEERTSTLSVEDMASAQAAAQMKELSKSSAEQQPGVCNMWISFIEIYNEVIYDLLQPFTSQRQKLTLGEDKNGNVYIKGALEICVSNCEEALELLKIGRKNLSVASTKMNYQSSRSHCIYTIKTVRIPDASDTSRGLVNRLSFCDLAGSERVSKTHTSGIRLKEAGAINTSLLVLGRCLEQLRANQAGSKKLVPFRESKLTRLFSGFFLGQGKAVMIANASPSEYTFDETLHVLMFSALAKKLLVNDSYVSAASVSLKSMVSQWENFKANASNMSANLSLESADTDYDVMEEKDQIIEKLFALADSLTNDLQKERKEKAELESSIRQEVCKEYSEYSDQLLENQRMNFEQEIEAIKDIYKKRLAATERTYEEIIKSYKDQLSETEDGSILDDSTRSLDDIRDTLKDRKSLSVFNTPDIVKNEESLEKYQKEACNVQEKSAEEMKQNESKICILQKECEELKSLIFSKDERIVRLEEDILKNNESLKKYQKEMSHTEEKYGEEVKKYENKLSDLQKDYDELKVVLLSKDETIEHLKKEIEKQQKTIETLSENFEEASFKQEKFKEDIILYLDKLSALEKELNSKEDYEDMKKTLLSKTDEIIELKKEIKTLENTLETYKLKEKELKSEIHNYESTVPILNKEISDLQEELVLLSQNKESDVNVEEFNSMKVAVESLKEELEFTKEKLRIQSLTYQELENEIKDYKTGLEKLKNVCEGLDESGIFDDKNVYLKCESIIHKLKQEIELLEQEKLDAAVKESEEKSLKTATETEDIKDYKFGLERLRNICRGFDKSEVSESTDVFMRCESIIQDLKHQVLSGQEELKVALKESEEKSVKLTTITEEMKEFELGLELLKNVCELNKSEDLNEKGIFLKCESVIHDLKHELTAAEKELEEKSCKLMAVTKEMKKHKHELEELKILCERFEESQGLNEESIFKKCESIMLNFKHKLIATKRELEEKSLELDAVSKETKEFKLGLEILKNVCAELNKSEDLNEKGIFLKCESIIRDLKHKLNSAEKELEEKSCKLKAVTKEIQDYKNGLEKLKDICEDFDTTEYSENTNIYMKYVSAINDLKCQLLSKQEKLNAAAKQLEEKSIKLLKADEENQAFKMGIEKLKEVLEGFDERRVSENADIYVKCASVINNLKNQLSLEQEKLKAATKELEAKSLKLVTADEENQDTKIGIEMLKEVCEGFDAENKNIFMKCASVINDLKNQLLSEQEKLSANAKELEEKSVKLLAADQENRDIKVGIEKLEEVCEGFDAENKNIFMKCASIINDLKNRLLAEQEKLNATTKELEEKSVKLLAADQENQDTKVGIEKLKEVCKGFDTENKNIFIKCVSVINDLNNRLLSEQEKLNVTAKELEEKSVKLLAADQENQTFKMGLEKLKEGLKGFDRSGVSDIYMKCASAINDLKHELSSEKEKLKTATKELEEKSTRLLKADEDIKYYKLGLKKLQNVCKEFDESEASDEESIFSKCESVINELKNQISLGQDTVTAKVKELEEKSLKLMAVTEEMQDYKIGLEKLKDVCKEFDENGVSENIDIYAKCQTIIHNLKNQLLTEQEKLSTAVKESDENSLKLKTALKEIKDYNDGLEKLKKICKGFDKSGKTSIYVKCESIIQDLKLQLQSEQEKLNAALKESDEKSEKLLAVTKEIEEYKDGLKKLKQLCGGFDKSVKTSIYAKCESLIENLKLQVLSEQEKLKAAINESNEKSQKLSEVTKALSNSLEESKKNKLALEKKIFAEKEQHGIEIQQTMELKHLVEEENKILKEENSKLKADLKRESSDGKGKVPRQSESTDGKVPKKRKSFEEKEHPLKIESKVKIESVTEEIDVPRQSKSSAKGKVLKRSESEVKVGSVTEKKDISRASRSTDEKEMDSKQRKSTEESVPKKSTRALRANTIPKPVIEADTESEDEIKPLTRKSNKRVSEDFVPPNEKRRKTKQSTESKIPDRKVTRKKPQEETSSPVQKVAKYVGNKLRSVAESVSSRIPSPQVRNTRKKLFNPDANAVFSGTERVTRRRKT